MTVTLANAYPFKPGEQVGPHASASTLLLLCRRGRGWLDLTDGTWELGPGDALLLPWDAPRWYRAASADPFTLIGVHRVPRGGDGGHPEHRRIAPWPRCSGQPASGELRHDVDGHLATAAERLVTLFNGPAEGRAEALAAWAAVLDCEWRRLARPVGAGAGPGDRRLNAVAAWLRLNLARQITRRELAQRAGLAESTFAAAFRDAYGAPPLQYLIALRVARARELLATTTMPIPEVARTCGFSDLPYFARTFRRHAKTTATAFRRSRMLI